MAETPAPTTGAAQEHATISDAIDLRALALIGIFGPEADLRALIRLPNGRIERVGVGDRVARQDVVAIGADAVVLARGSKTQRLAFADPS